MTTSYLAHASLPFCALTCSAIGATTDLRSRRVPNWLTGPAILVGLLLHLADGGWKGCTSSLLALVLCGAVFFILHLAGGMGAGDVKLMAAQASLLGFRNAGPLLLYTVLCGGLMGLALAIRRGKLWQTLTNVVVLTSHHSKNGLQPHPELNVLNTSALRLPYAIAIGCGCMLTVALQTSWWQAL